MGSPGNAHTTWRESLPILRFTAETVGSDKSLFAFPAKGRERCHNEQGSVSTEKGLSHHPLWPDSLHVTRLISGSVTSFTSLFILSEWGSSSFYSILLSTTLKPLGEWSKESSQNIRSYLWRYFSFLNMWMNIIILKRLHLLCYGAQKMLISAQMHFNSKIPWKSKPGSFLFSNYHCQYYFRVNLNSIQRLQGWHC